MTVIDITGKWQVCKFQTKKNGRLYCQLIESWCKPQNCKEQMIK